MIKSNAQSTMRGSRHDLLPLTSDLVFKAAFGKDTPQSKKALIRVLNLILDRHGDQITDIVYKNPFNYADSIEGKTTIMDIKVVTESGEWIDIEMQVNNLEFHPERSIIYNARIVSEQLATGEFYDKLKKTIVISIVQGQQFPQTKRFCNSFVFMERAEHFILSELCELQFIELDKIDTGKQAEEMTPLERFGVYLKYAADETKADYVSRILDQGDEVIAMTEQILRSVSQDDLLREQQNARELAKLFYNWDIADARKEGEARGEAKGEAKGEARGRAEMCLKLAQKMKALGKTTDEICELTGLSRAQIDSL